MFLSINEDIKTDHRMLKIIFVGGGVFDADSKCLVVAVRCDISHRPAACDGPGGLS